MPSAIDSHTNSIVVNGDTVGTVSVSLEITLDDTLEPTVADELLRCIVSQRFADLTSDHATAASRAIRDSDSFSSVEEPVRYKRTVTETFGRGSFTLTFEASLLVDMQVHNHRNACDLIEAELIAHIQQHLNDPLHEELREAIEADSTKPGLHLIALAKGTSPRALAREQYLKCIAAQNFIAKFFPDQPLPLPEIAQYIQHSDGFQVVIGLDVEEAPTSPDEGIGQYL